jgi:hypothetical protein
MNERTMTFGDTRSRAIWLALAFGVSGVGGGAAGQAPPAPTPPPATTAPSAPLPGPKAVAIAFIGSIEKGDAATARGLLPGDPANGRWVDAAVGLSAALKKLDAVAVERFGEPGRNLTHNQLHLADAAKALEQAQEKMEGDWATVTVPGRAEPLGLKKTEGRWQLELSKTSEDLATQTALYTRLTRVAERTAQEIAAGAYPSAEAAARVFTARVLDARLRVE